MASSVLVAKSLLCFALLAAVTAAMPARAQTMYRYKDANGVWVYTDRKPAEEQEFQQEQIERRFEKPEVTLFQRSDPGGVMLIAKSTYFGPVQIAFRVHPIENVSAKTHRSGLTVLPPRSETEVVFVGKSVEQVDLRFDSEFQFIPGQPGAEHRPEQPYRLPYALSSAVRVSQAYPVVKTHGDPASQYAVDVVMLVGTTCSRRATASSSKSRAISSKAAPTTRSTGRAPTSCESCTPTARWRSTCT